MATEVAVVTASTGSQTFYSTYASARSAASSGDLIEIWADLTNEQILLKDGVDIWIAPGRVIKTSDSETLIIDNDGGYTTAVNVNITGYGIFKNTSDKYGCLKLVNSNSKVSITCERMENDAYDNTSFEPSTIYIVHALKFHLNCNSVTNAKQRAIYFENEVGDININADIIESGDSEGGDVITTKGSGFLNANEVICNNDSSCLFHKAGTLTANILKLTTTDNAVETGATVRVSSGTETPVLTLYFDEIQNLSSESGNAVDQLEGVMNLIGRRIYSEKGLSMDLRANANILVDEIISVEKGIFIANAGNQKTIIDSNYIEGSIGNYGVIYSLSGAHYSLKNAMIKNTSPEKNSICIYLQSGEQDDQTIEIENLILVTGNTEDGETIYRDGETFNSIVNLLLFVNKEIDQDKVVLLVGTGLISGENYKYIYSADVN
jgi:hypothetical protein